MSRICKRAQRGASGSSRVITRSFGVMLREDDGQLVAQIPIVVTLLVALILILLQPCLILYCRLIASNAAAQTARVLVTADMAVATSRLDGAAAPTGTKCKAVVSFAKRRLGAIPTSPYFIDGDPRITWDRSGDLVKVTIEFDARPLPVMGAVATFLAQPGGDGFLISETAKVPAAYTPAHGVEGNPDSWDWTTLGE